MGKLKFGDVVKHKDSSEKMTVKKIIENEVECIWITSDNILRKQSFSEGDLKKQDLKFEQISATVNAVRLKSGGPKLPVLDYNAKDNEVSCLLEKETIKLHPALLYKYGITITGLSNL